jgi:hypothetical protein
MTGIAVKLKGEGGSDDFFKRLVLGFRSSGADLIGVYPVRSNFRAGEDRKACSSRQALDSHNWKADGLHRRHDKYGDFLCCTNNNGNVYDVVWQIAFTKSVFKK